MKIIVDVRTTKFVNEMLEIERKVDDILSVIYIFLTHVIFFSKFIKKKNKNRRARFEMI